MLDANPGLHRPPIDRPLLWFTALSGLTITLPFLFSALLTDTLIPTLTVCGFMLSLPYVVIVLRLVRAPGRKEGPGLAVGVATTIALAGILVVAAEMAKWEYRIALYVSCVLLLHFLTIGFGVAAFRRSTSDKSTWRIVVRSVIDPIAYFGILLVLLMGSIAFHR